METSELLQVLREQLNISINVDSDWECDSEYASIAVTLSFIDDEGENHEISHDYGSVRINSH